MQGRWEAEWEAAFVRHELLGIHLRAQRGRWAFNSCRLAATSQHIYSAAIRWTGPFVEVRLPPPPNSLRGGLALAGPACEGRFCCSLLLVPDLAKPSDAATPVTKSGTPKTFARNAPFIPSYEDFAEVGSTARLSRDLLRDFGSKVRDAGPARMRQKRLQRRRRSWPTESRDWRRRRSKACSG
ncbi:MAG: hypothetical protein QOD42_438 [Sphingomonadales bacterium]|jgi:hypothetical protein|nr:hypothetical protein [Sphingomonadales bacterium]